MCVSVARSPAPLVSSRAVAVTVRAVFHVLAVKISRAGAMVTASAWLFVSDTVTFPPTGCVASRTVYGAA